VTSYLAEHGRPITYSYVDRTWPLDAYQTVFARTPGSAEMPSAARPFTTRVVTDPRRERHRGRAAHPAHRRLVAGGRGAADRRAIRRPRCDGRPGQPHPPPRRPVVAVGTTVTRALETVAAADGRVRPGQGVTDLVLGPDRPPRVVSGLVTGWHAPGASHLSLLQSVAGPDLVRTAYDAAVAQGYLWHEFGDSCLLLPAL